MFDEIADILELQEKLADDAAQRVEHSATLDRLRRSAR